MTFAPEIEAKIVALFDAVPQETREDIGAAIDWARETLTKLEGGGHQFNVLPDGQYGVCCAFEKPEWAGDHCGDRMETGSEAIIRAVCEYIAERAD